MKPRIMAEIERIAGNRLTPQMREEIAEQTLKIVMEINRMATLAAIETAKQVIETTQESTKQNAPSPTLKKDPRSA